MVNFNEAPSMEDVIEYVKDVIESKHTSGDGKYTKLCNSILKEYTASEKSLLVHSGTAALEMSALLLNIQPGDEVICPSYTFVTTASAFALRGAKLVFVDVREDTANIDETKIEAAITPKTKALVVVHYAGVSCDMDKVMSIARRHSLAVVEDAAQALGSYYKGKACGGIADFGCFSFHETKNITCGEGGALNVNNQTYIESAEIIREKGTNRSRFFRGLVDKYTWIDLGSSYLPSDIIAANLYSQMTKIDEINKNRLNLWDRYYSAFENLAKSGIVTLPYIPKECSHNAHMFYLKLESLERRTEYIDFMKNNGVMCVFHYIPLHSSPAGEIYGRVSGDMSVTNKISNTLVRLPIYYNMQEEKQNLVIRKTIDFFTK